jgi:PAS domain S-box-containing protein
MSRSDEITDPAGDASFRRDELERALHAVRDANRKLEAIIEASPLAIIALDREGIVKSWNPAAERIYGWTEAEVLERVLPTVPAEKREEMERNHQAAVRGKAFTNYETERQRKDGSTVHVSISTAPLLDAEGETAGVVALVADITERKRAEEVLAAQAETLREQAEIIEQAYDAIILRDPSNAITLWNQGAVRMYGFAKDEVLGVSPHELLKTETPIPLKEIYRLLRRDGYWEGELKHTRKDGAQIVVESRWATVVNERDEVTSILEINRNITERKRAEERLRESEERYRVFVTQSSEAIWRLELDPPVPINLSEDKQIEHFYAHGHLAESNDVMARMYGFSRAEELHGVHLEEMLPRTPDNLAYLRAAVRAGYRLTDAESQELDRDGKPKYFLNNLVGIVEGGLLRRVWGTQRDVTERRQAEEEQKFLSDATTVLASSLDYAATLDAVAHMAAAYLADYCLVDLLEDDSAITRLVVAHRDPEREAAWREMQRRFPLDPASPHTIPQVMRTGEPLIYAEHTDEMLERALSDAEQIKVLKGFGIKSSMIVPLRARGRTVGAVSFISAESGRRYAASELRLAEEFARRAALAVDNARLYQRAQEANRTKDEFLATLSHELRTPLTPIIGWVHLLGGKQVTPDDFAHGLAIIDKNSQALSRLINDLLDMSAILNGKMRIDHSPVSVNSILHEAVETVRTQADKRGVEIELAPCGGSQPAFVSGDRTRLVQVFWNLFSNAVKFSPDGGGVRVACEREEASLNVHIEDEGVGIAPEFLPHVFDRFRQADMSTTKLYGGLGIGLALVRSFVEAHGGTVKAESAGLGSGSRFTVTLPLMELRNAECGLRIDEGTAVPSSLASDDAKPDLSNPQSAIRIPQSLRRVLVVEDSPDTLEMLRVFFAARGFEPTVCVEAREALDIASRAHIDIIVTDIGLPNIDGYELLRRLRQESPHLAGVPALALTGYAAETDMEAARVAGFAAHIAKPFEPEALAVVVEHLLARADSEVFGTDGE